MRRALPRILYATAIAALAFAVASAGRMAWANWLAGINTPESVIQATRLDPANASYHALLAEHQEALGHDPKPELKTAAALSPREARYRARLAFRAEVENDDGVSEKYLLQAADIDRMFTPRWSLANFYLRLGDERRGDLDRFWQWLRSSAEMSPTELSAIFQVAWAVAKDGEKVRSILPQRREVLRQYVAWLTENQPLAEATKAAMDLAREATAPDAAVLLNFCDKVAPLDSGSALSVWNAMCNRKVLPYAALDPGSGHVVTNESFSLPLVQQAFGWRLVKEPGVSQALADSGSGLVIRLSGKQAERTGLLVQWIPLKSHRRYRLSWEYRVAGNSGVTGMHWELPQFQRDTELLTEHPALRANEWTTEHTEFESSQDAAARLMLFYQRMPGMIPWEGALYLRKVDVEALP